MEKVLAFGDWSGLTSPALGEGSQVSPTCMVTHSMEIGTLAGPCMVSKCMYDPCASLWTPACREPAPRVTDIKQHVILQITWYTANTGIG